MNGPAAGEERGGGGEWSRRVSNVAPNGKNYLLVIVVLLILVFTNVLNE